MQPLRAAHVGDAEARHRRAGLQAGELLVQRHRRQDGVDALLDRQRRVAERRVGRCALRGLLRDERGGQQAARAEDEQGLGEDRLPGHGTHLQGGAQRSTTSRSCSRCCSRSSSDACSGSARETWQKLLAAAAVVQADRPQDALEGGGVGRFVAVGDDRQRVEQVPVGELDGVDGQALFAAERRPVDERRRQRRAGRRASPTRGSPLALHGLLALHQRLDEGVGGAHAGRSTRPARRRARRRASARSGRSSGRRRSRARSG